MTSFHPHPVINASVDGSPLTVGCKLSITDHDRSSTRSEHEAHKSSEHAQSQGINSNIDNRAQQWRHRRARPKVGGVWVVDDWKDLLATSLIVVSTSAH